MKKLLLILFCLASMFTTNSFAMQNEALPFEDLLQVKPMPTHKRTHSSGTPGSRKKKAPKHRRSLSGTDIKQLSISIPPTPLEEKENKQGKILIINGTSSSGKSTICKRLMHILEEQSDDFWVYQAIDDIPDTPVNSDSDDEDNQGESDGEDFLLEKVHLKMIAKIRSLANKGFNVVCDTVIPVDEELSAFCELLEGFEVNRVLVYCPLPQIEQNVARRNSTGDKAEKRCLWQSVRQFLDMYKPHNNEDLNSPKIDSLSEDDVKEGCSSPHMFDHGKQPSDKEIERLVWMFQSSLNLESKDTIITPRSKYDHIVKNGQGANPTHLALQIYNFLNK